MVAEGDVGWLPEGAMARESFWLIRPDSSLNFGFYLS